MKKKSILFVLFVMFWLGVLRVSVAAAVPATVPTDVDSPSSGCTFLGIEGKYEVI